MKNFFIIAIGLISLLSTAQVGSNFSGKAKDFIELKNRPLIVELLQEEENILKKLDKPKKAEELRLYKKMVKFYNEEITNYAKKYWTINKSIEFKTSSEVEDLKKDKNKSYAVLRNLRLNDLDDDFKSKLYINVIAYSRIESNKIKADAQVFFPVISDKKDVFLEESDYKQTLNLLQDNINYIISEKKTINSDDYVKRMAKGNCDLVKNKTLLVKESMLFKGVRKADCIKSYGGKIDIVSDNELNRAFVDKDKDKVVLFSVPYEIAKAGIGPIGQSFIISYKVIVDCETGKILYVFMPKGLAVMGQNLFQYMIPKDFENIKNCK